jgi:hypothetical protein
MNVPRSQVLASALTATSLLLHAPAVGAAGAAAVTRYVLSYSGPDAAWEIVRGSQHIAPKNGLPLALGDCVYLRAPAGTDGGPPVRMTVIAAGREIVLDPARPRYCMMQEQQKNPVAVAIARTFASLAGVFHGAEQAYDEHSTIPMTTRGVGVVPPALPLLADHPQQLGAGTRALALAWTRGTPPYTVVLTRARQPEVLASAQTPMMRVRLKPVLLAPGSYSVTVTDAEQATGAARFTVVPANGVPPSSADVTTVLRDNGTPAGVRAAFDAARLMAIRSESWRLEAYQRVADHGSGSALAARLIFDLETGG